MFTDTKNLVHANKNSEACNIKPNNVKTNGKLRSLWRLLKLRKSVKRKSHPNNMNLNNCASTQTVQIEELTTAQLEDYCAKIATEAGEQRLQPSEAVSETSKECLKVISSASIEKCALSTGISCIYGKNCQHNHKAAQQKQLFAHYTELQLGEPAAQINYLHTEDGSFFWPESFDRIDDDLLNVWLCQSLGQFPTQASLAAC